MSKKDDIVFDGEDNPEELKTAQELVKERCVAAGLGCEISDLYGLGASIDVDMPNGEGKRSISLFSLASLNDFLSIPFEEYIFLGDYIAICSYKNGSIEAVIRSVANIGNRIIYKRLFNEAYNKEASVSNCNVIQLSPEDGSETVRIEISNTSEFIKAFYNSTTSRFGSLSLKISGIKIDQHDRALTYLKSFSDSLFFQIDMQTNIPLLLVREPNFEFSGLKFMLKSNVSDFQFPKNCYDEAPISLYWYARSSTGMPLLQFLAYYQVIEFYFFSYSLEEAREKIKNILKDPTFRTDRDTDIAKVLSVVNTKGRGYGDERSQLRATLRSCIDANELRQFLTKKKDRKKVFSNKQIGLTNCKVPIDNLGLDLRDSVAELIYDIRCRIVHTKGDTAGGEIDLLLPFSKESKLLYDDISLMRYIARKILINASSPLQL